MWERLTCFVILISIHWTCITAQVCGFGWLEHEGSCYKRVDAPNGWLGARHHCVLEGGDLVSISSSAEQAFLKKMMKSNEFWLGLSNLKCDVALCNFKDGNLTWSDGETTTYTNWAKAHPRSTSVASCAYVKVLWSYLPWMTVSCTSPLKYVCKRPLKCPAGRTCTPKDSFTAVTTSDCDNGWMQYGNFCYDKVYYPGSWVKGERYCLKKGSHLASVHSEEEVQFMSDFTYHNWIWVGLKVNNNNYEWSDGTDLDYTSRINRRRDGVGLLKPDGTIQLWDDGPYVTDYVMCQKAKRGGLRQLPLVGQPRWTDKCGWWLDDPFNDFCYLINRQPTETWQEAENDCRRFGGNLLSITDFHEQIFVHSFIKALAMDALWLGAKTPLDGAAKWTDGSLIAYVHLIAGDADKGKCLSFLTGSGHWKADTCDKKNGYVCKKRGEALARVPEPKPSSDDAKRCDPGWLKYDGSCYKKVEAPNGWLGARHHCVSEGGDLLSISSSAEEDFVKKTMMAHFWLGLSNLECDDIWCRFQDGNLTWSDGETLTHANWASDQPGSTDVASCAYVKQGTYDQPGKWISGSCASSLAYVCERPLNCSTCARKDSFAVVATSDCSEGNLLYDDYCYHYEKSAESWEESERFCVDRGGHLASVHSEEEARFVYGHGQSPYSSFLGLKKNKWSDGTKFDYQKRENNTVGDCVFPTALGELSSCHCTVNRPFVCKIAKSGRPRQLSPLVGQPDWTVQCGWWLDNPTDDFCYLIVRQPKTWKEAQEDCHHLEGNLLSITSSHEQTFVHGYIKAVALNDDDAPLWLGVKSPFDDDDTKWTDGSLFKKIKDFEDDGNDEKCLTFLTGSGDWKADACDHKSGYMCKKRAKGVADAMAPSDNNANICGLGWLKYDASCYKKVEAPNGWLGAHHHCVWEGGDLLSISSSAEEDFVKKTMMTHFWLGLSNLKCDDIWCRFEDGNLTWSDGETLTHTNWASDQPGSTDVASCAYVKQGTHDQSGKWMSGSCASSLAYVCERPLKCPAGRTCARKGYAFKAVKTSDCSGGDLLYNDYCYHYEGEAKSWEEAEKFCRSRRGHLASIHSKEEAQFVYGHSYTQHSSFVGRKKVEWSDGTEFDYQALENNTVGDCAFPTALGELSSCLCTVTRPFVCKTAKRGGPRQLPPFVGQPDWTDQCGWWLDNPTDDFCYLIVRQPKTWTEAQDECQRLEGHLSSITDFNEQNFLHGYIKALANAPSLWLGANTSIIEDDTKWTDGSPFAYIRSSAGDADASSRKTCLSFLTGSGDWKADRCSHMRGYMCKKTKKGVTAPSPFPLHAKLCDPGWLEYEDRCYKKVEAPNGWLGARRDCVWQGGDLVSITSSAEEDFVKDAMGKKTPFWLGLSTLNCDDVWCDFVGGNLTWSDGKMLTITNWASNQPGSTDVASCVYVNQGAWRQPGKWRSGSCASSLAYMCMRPADFCPDKERCFPKGGSALVATSSCDDGHFLYGDYCYRYEEMLKDCDEAEDFCRAWGGHLASAHSDGEAQFLAAHKQSAMMPLVGQRMGVNGKYYDYSEWDSAPSMDCKRLASNGKLHDVTRNSTRPFFCKKAKHGGPRQLPGGRPAPPPSVSLAGWTDKCGWWLDDPSSDFCYLINRKPKTWNEAQDDCQRQKGNLLSITDSHEQNFVHGYFKALETGPALWLGANETIDLDGGKWADGSPFSYVHFSAGDTDGGKCLSFLTGSGHWNVDACDNTNGYVCKKRGNGKPSKPLPPNDGYMKKIVCQEDRGTLKCPEERVIRIRSAFYGRRRSDVCPNGNATDGTCTVDLSFYKTLCDNDHDCTIYLSDSDSCPGVSSIYLHIVYSCEETVCLDSLTTDGSVADSAFSASSSMIKDKLHKAHLGGSGCWLLRKKSGSWIQVNLGQRKKVTALVTQSCNTDVRKRYTVLEMQISIDGKTWYTHPDGQFGLGTRLLATPVFTQYVRLLPVDYRLNDGFRFDVLGCAVDNTAHITCASNFKSLTKFTSSKTVLCPPGCGKAPHIVYGTSIYNQDSNICTAAIHAGIIRNEIGGAVTLLKAPPQNADLIYTENGITLVPYGGKTASYAFAENEPRCLGPDWEEFAGFCYKRLDDQKTWYGAQHACRSVCAELVSIRSEAERDWLQEAINFGTGDAWTGLNDLVVKGRFMWSDRQKVTFTNWAKGDPARLLENCVAMLSQTGKWRKMSCVRLNSFVCKMPTARYPIKMRLASGVAACRDGVRVWNNSQ
ncbi:secretory phospholipase A2 receptor isoform X2 [Syngnathus scovelli]|uniref:secretory phospholipase A2 receptor isoform X2 n=1 Tax=Syngnathus scovelli TaxID=161590 RepID=UPI0035CA64E9